MKWKYYISYTSVVVVVAAAAANKCKSLILYWAIPYSFAQLLHVGRIKVSF